MIVHEELTTNPHHVIHMEASKRDAMKIFPNEGPYVHLVDVADTWLCHFGNPVATTALAIHKWTDDVWSFQETGGPLGNVTIRGFFGVFSEFHQVVVAGFEKVQHAGGPRGYMIVKIENRLSYYGACVTCTTG